MRAHLHRYRFEYLVISSLLAVLTVWIPPWPELLWYFIVMYYGCPDYHFLGTSCGDFTFSFIMERIINTAPFLAVAYMVWTIYRGWKFGNAPRKAADKEKE